MHLLKLLFSAVLGALAFIIATKLLVVLLGLIGLVLNLIWIAAIVGIIALVGWVIYRIVAPPGGLEEI
jgi:hypothetical protein